MGGLLVPVIGVETHSLEYWWTTKFVIGQGGVSSGGNVVDEIKKGNNDRKGMMERENNPVTLGFS